MRHATVIHLLFCLCPWLVLVWLLQRVADRCGFRKRGWVRLVVPGLVAAGILAVPVEGASLLGWVIGLNANFSIPFTGLMAAAVWEGAFSQSIFAERDWRAGWVFGLLAGVLLYPLALGWGRFDPYGWGWHFSPLFVAGAAVSALLLWRQNRFGLLLLLAIIAYHLRLLESTNYWDYLVDPVYCLVSIPAFVRRLVPGKMNVEFQRRVDSTLGPLICALLSVVDRFRGKPVAARPPRRILVILLSEMGSLVLAQAMFARLKQQYPGASIHALVFARNREVLDLMGLIPKANVLTLDDRSMVRFMADGFKMLFTLRGLRLDVVMDCELFARISSILSYLTGAPVRVGFHRHTQEGLYRGSFINRPVLYNPYRHISRQFLTLAAAIESDTVPVGKDTSAPLPQPPPWLDFSEEQVRQVVEKLHTDFPSVKGRKLILVYPSGGILPIRAWPREHYFQLCTALLAEGCAVGIIGLQSDKPLAQTIVAQCRDVCCVDLTGYTQSIQHLLTLFHRASLVITNDGGPGQLAALTPAPVIVLFGPETPALYRPLADKAHCFHLSLPCSPCLTAYNHRTSPCDGDNQCLKQIMPGQVLAKAREILGPMPSTEQAGPR